MLLLLVVLLWPALLTPPKPRSRSRPRPKSSLCIMYELCTPELMTSMPCSDDDMLADEDVETDDEVMMSGKTERRLLLLSANEPKQSRGSWSAMSTSAMDVVPQEEDDVVDGRKSNRDEDCP